MFGVEKRVRRIQATLVTALQNKAMYIMQRHAAKRPQDIPVVDTARSMILMDLATIIGELGVEKQPGEDE